MKQIDIYKKYKEFGVKPNILAQYKDGQEYIIYNEDDRDLDNIRVDLPKTPDWNLIDGFGLPAKEQFFVKQTIPLKIIELQQEQDEDGEFLTQDEIWERLEAQPEFYKKEIEFIRLQWKRRLEGYWFFNNGVATYIDGWHYVYCNFFELDIGLPEYRDRDRRFFHFARYCFNDKKCFGFVYPKHRREGATYKTSCIHYCIISMLIKARGGIQSMTDDSGKDVFQKHIVDPWRTMPFFFKPNHDGGDDPKKKLAFRPSASRGKVGIKNRSKKALYSEIEYRASSELAFDGTKLYFYHHEEVGKAKDVDINKRWEVVQLTLATGAGSNIHGFSIHTSTVGEMELGGGDQFKEMCDNSMYAKRNANGQTATGLYILFIPAWDGLEGFVDEYGMSVIDIPTEEQAEYLGKEIGAKAYIENSIASLKLLPKKTKLLQFQREHPTTFRGCFRTNTKEPFFNIAKLEDRIDELAIDPNAIKRGRLDWEDPSKPFRCKVIWTDDESGRFEKSYDFKPDETNRVAWNAQMESYEALNLHFCAGADPFKFGKVKGKTGSDGGGAVYWGHDIRLDPPGKPMDQWESCRFIMAYSFRPDTTDEYCEDMAKMCMYCGCPMNTEYNVEEVRKMFTRWGLSRMLVHKYKGDSIKGKFEEQAGIYTDDKIKQTIFGLFKTQIERHCHRERHSSMLFQVLRIKGLDDMTNWDLFAAGGMAMVGIDNYWIDMQKENQEEQNYAANEYFEEFSYSKN